MMLTPELRRAARNAERQHNDDRTGLYPVSMAARTRFLHPGTIRRWIRERRIPVYGWRGAYRVRLEDLLPVIG